MLYKLEESYRKVNLTPEQDPTRRNDAETEFIIESMRNEMFDLLVQSKETLSDLMNKALNYLHTSWKQLFAYRNHGEYTIDNTAAERAIRPITIHIRTACSSVVYREFRTPPFIIRLLKSASRWESPSGTTTAGFLEK